MFGNSLDNFLRNDTTSQGANVVEFSATGSCTVVRSVDCLLLKYHDKAFVGKLSHSKFRDGVYLQLARVFSNLSLDCRVLLFLNVGVCLFDKIVRNLEGDPSELL